MTQPVSGTTDFNDLGNGGGVSSLANSGGTTASASNIDGWDIDLTTAQNGAYIFAGKYDGSQTSIAAGSGQHQVNSVELTPDDDSQFTLNSIDIFVLIPLGNNSSASVKLQGYLNGVAVTGASLTQSVGNSLSSYQTVSFNVSSNPAFAGITSFKITSTDFASYFGFDNINATNFLVPGPILTPTNTTVPFVAADNAASTPIVVDSGVTLVDATSTTLASATVAITGNLHSSEDVLGFVNDDPTTYGNITASYDSLAGTLTLTSAGATATVAQFQAALRAVTYTNSAVTPNDATRTITFAANDGSLTSPAVTRSVSVTDTDQTPILTLDSGAASFVSGDNTTSTPVAIDSELTLTDGDDTTLASAAVSITGGFHAGEDVLGFVNTNATLYGNITASYDALTGVLTLSSSGSTATVAQWTNALQAVTYTDTAVSPDTATRTISFTVNDGTVDSAVVTRDVTVTATDQSPIVTPSGVPASFVAGDNVIADPVTVDGALLITDADNTTLATVTVAITGNFHASEDLLAFTNDDSTTYGNIAATYDSPTGTLTLTSAGATATLAQWQSALRNVSYANTAVSPDPDARTISFTASDGTSSSLVATSLIEISPTDQTPLVTASLGTAAFVAGDNAIAAPIAIDPGFVVTDLDNPTLAGATVAITGNFQPEDFLSFVNDDSALYGNIAASYDGQTGVLTLTSDGASATLAQWQAALRSVAYGNAAITPDTDTRTISFAVDDGTNTSLYATRDVTVTDTDQTPLIGVNNNIDIFVAGDNVASTPIVVAADLVVMDLDNPTLASATVEITQNFQSGEDVLAFTNDDSLLYGNIAAASDANTGQLQLTSAGSTAAVAQWQAALRAVTYTDTAITPSGANRQISFTINDGTVSSFPATRSIHLFPTDQTPILLPDTGTAAFVEGDNVATSVAIGSDLTITDRDNPTLASAIVAIAENFQPDEDLLAFTNDDPAAYGNITATYDPANGQLLLSSAGSTATLAQWQAALRRVTYADTAVTPANIDPRGVIVIVNDGTNDSLLATRIVSVTATLQSPIVTPSPGSSTALMPNQPVAVDPGITITDHDSSGFASATIAITGNSNPAEDLLSFVNTDAFGNITGSYDPATGIMTLTSAGSSATTAQWQAALRAVTYTDTVVAAHTAPRTISISLDDGINTSIPATRTIDIGAVSQTPINSDTTGIYRFFDAATGTHFFTTSAAERNALTDPNSPNYHPEYTQEANGFTAVDPASGDPDMIPVYRFFDAATGAHFMTSSASERDDVMNPAASNYASTYVYEPLATF